MPYSCLLLRFRQQVPLYERGYEKDPAKVAAEAIKVAERDGRDVVLVDTAGRMQVRYVVIMMWLWLVNQLQTVHAVLMDVPERISVSHRTEGGVY